MVLFFTFSVFSMFRRITGSGCTRFYVGVMEPFTVVLFSKCENNNGKNCKEVTMTMKATSVVTQPRLHHYASALREDTLRVA
jgi:hypothetical protein